MELPPVWRSPPGIYPNSLPDVLAASFRQTLESVKYYGEMELWRIVIFRGLIVLLCMIPIKLFNDERRKNKILSDTNLTFLARFPKTASLVMGMSLAPFIFVNPPHAFMEFILLGLTFTVTTLTLQNYPKTNKPILITLIAAFMVLYLINFFVTPTFIGRLIYTSSIFLLVPLFLMNKKISTFELKYEKTTRVFLLFMAVHLVAGWVCVILGYYTLGRSIILASYSLLILTMILRIAIYTLLDYVEILSYFFNNRVRTVRINTAYVHRKTKPLLILFSILFLVMAYLYNMNVFDLVRSGLHDFMVTPRKIGSSTFDYLSVFLFFASVYLAFLIASIIRNAFDPSHDHTVEHRSNLGSYLLLFRLLILITGFTVGILASGLPLTNFAILLGAMGVGIGLGLQNIISNLVSGLIIAFERPFVVGDVLDFEKESCTVKEISLRATQVSTSDGANILIPNNTLLSANLKNWTISTKQRLLEVKVLTGHDVKPETVIEIISGCLNDDGNIIRKKSVVLLSEINDTGMVFVVKVLITNLSNASSIKSQLLSSIHAEFTSHNIRFPRNKSSVND
jgi:small-conductance mechanosensitive channel